MHAQPSNEWRDWTFAELNSVLVLAGIFLAALVCGPIYIACAGLRHIRASCRDVFAARSRGSHVMIATH
jgi:hypothetical protein